MRNRLPLDVLDLVNHRTIEGVRVELKATWSDPARAQVVRTMCAFANDLYNQNGGYIVIGVEERDGRAVLPPKGVPADLVDRVQKEVFEDSHLITPAYAPLIAVEQIDGRSVVVLWCPGGDNRPYKARGPRGGLSELWVRQGSATTKPSPEQERQLLEVAARTPFDVRRSLDATTFDVSPSLVRRHLHQVRSGLADLDLDDEEVLRRMDLLVRVNGHEVPRNVAVLFFAPHPERFLPGARIELAVYGDGAGGDVIVARELVGPLPEQVEACLAALRGLLPERTVKVPDRAEAERTPALPFAAVEEALVNAVYHRGYERDRPDPTKVHLFRDRLVITSYPGPVPGVSAEHLSLDMVPAVPARNRRIGELLKELKLAEARGSGIPKIRRAMRTNGNPAPTFVFDAERTWFEATLPLHRSFVVADVARRPIPLGRVARADEVIGRDALVAQVWAVLQHQDVHLEAPIGRGLRSFVGLLAASPPPGWAVWRVRVAGRSADGVWAALGELAGVALDAQVGAPKSERIAGAMVAGLGADGRRLVIFEGDPDGDDRWVWDEVLHAVKLLRSTDKAGCVRVVFARASGRSPTAQVVVVPPLTREATAALVGAWLGAAPSPAATAALVERSGGLPGVLVSLVVALAPRSSVEVVDVEAAYDRLLADDADPAGLSARFAHGRSLANEYGRVLRHVPLGGVTRADLVGAAVTAGLTRQEVLAAVGALTRGGVLVEVDGVVRFEHPETAAGFAAGPHHTGG
jgi:predicted HTH transcriptional regulator